MGEKLLKNYQEIAMNKARDENGKVSSYLFLWYVRGMMLEEVERLKALLENKWLKKSDRRAIERTLANLLTALSRTVAK